jgi:hypothetical protein
LNFGLVPILSGGTKINLKCPNSYYEDMGTRLITPHVNIVIVDKNNKYLNPVTAVNLNEKTVPFRRLKFHENRSWKNGPIFYQNKKLPIRSQWEIFRDSTYQNASKSEETDLWNLKPAK